MFIIVYHSSSRSARDNDVANARNARATCRKLRDSPLQRSDEPFVGMTRDESLQRWRRFGAWGHRLAWKLFQLCAPEMTSEQAKKVQVSAGLLEEQQLLLDSALLHEELEIFYNSSDSVSPLQAGSSHSQTISNHTKTIQDRSEF